MRVSMDRSDEKKARLAEALRANLKRRKAQSRAGSRAEAEAADQEPATASAASPHE